MAESTKPNINNKKGLIAGIIGAVAVILIIVICVLTFNKPGIVGKYSLTAFIDEDGKESTEMIDFLKAFGGSYSIEFKKDKTGVLEMKAGDESQTIEFTYTDKKLTIEKDGVKEESDYTYKDNTVTVSIENQGMKFTREEEKKQFKKPAAKAGFLFPFIFDCSKEN